VFRFILRRLGLGLITLWVLSLLIFFGTHILPGNPGRSMLGPFASPEAVAALNHDLGADQSLWTQYWTWIGDILHGDLGTSFAFKQPVADLVRQALENSLKLAVLAFVIVVPLSILGGVFAALHVGRAVDRTISIGGLSASAMPEFVGGIVLIVVFALWLNVLPVSARWPPGTPPLEQIKYLIMPALSLVLVLFGYIARMARAGTVTALDSDYARTATLKGLPRRTVVRRHVLRNALLPTITVIATQVGYLIGGLVVVEQLFNYNGFGTLLVNAARNRDYPQLQSAVLVIGVIYLIATLVADILYSVLNPRIRYGGAPE
jgi:peptide/nickel transport system permease protein